MGLNGVEMARIENNYVRRGVNLLLGWEWGGGATCKHRG